MDEYTLRQRRLRERKRRERRVVCGILAVILLLSCMVAGWLIVRHRRTRITMGSERVQLDVPVLEKQPREVSEMERLEIEVEPGRFRFSAPRGAVFGSALDCAAKSAAGV